MGLLDEALAKRRKSKRVEISNPPGRKFGGFLYYFEEMQRLGLNGGMDKQWKNRKLEE